MKIGDQVLEVNSNHGTIATIIEIVKFAGGNLYRVSFSENDRIKHSELLQESRIKLLTTNS